MKKILLAIIFSLILFFTLNYFESGYAQQFANKESYIRDSITRANLLKLKDQTLNNLTNEVELMHKYVDAGQKNLDNWLKILTTIFSVLIGYSIFNGFRVSEKAKDELKEMKNIGIEIRQLSSTAKNRLKKLAKVSDLISEVELNAKNAKLLESEATQKLNELSSRISITLDSAQERKLDDLIEQSKLDLQKSGIESFKNLYLAKSLKAQNEKRWEEVVRLTSAYLDLDEENGEVFGRRGFAYARLNDGAEDDVFWGKAMNDYTEFLKLEPENAWAYGSIGFLYKSKKNFESALENFSKAIELEKREVGRAYFLSSRAKLYKEFGKNNEAEKDMHEATELFPGLEDFLKSL